MRMGFARIAASAFVAALVAVSSQACSQGDGQGTIHGKLNVPDCWTGSFDFAPDFFAGDPYQKGLELRFQVGSDFETFSDGLSIFVYDIGKVQAKLRAPLDVSLPPEVTPPGVPVQANANPAVVSMSLYLSRSCQTQDVTLEALSQVTLPNDGTCDAPEMGAADPSSGCSATSIAGQGDGKSRISFTSIFDGNLDESVAAKRLTAGCFDVYLADPREVAPGGLGPPPPCRGHIKGTFSFFFERGRPAQPFP